MIDNLPVQTAQIYDYLSKGNFLCSNTSVKELRTLFSVVEDNFERLRDYFSHINFVLEQGNNYFYFSRKEPRATLSKSSSVSSLGSISWTSSVRTIRPSGPVSPSRRRDIGTFPYRHGSRDEAGRVEKTYRRQGETQGYPRYHLGQDDERGLYRVRKRYERDVESALLVGLPHEDDP